MKNIPIKFRGNSAVDAPNFINKGDFVFGSSIIQRHDKFWLGDDKGSYVDPDSVCQLVGYDINGAEVYEGDTVYFKNDNGEKSSLRVSAGTLLADFNCSTPDFVFKHGNLHNFIKEDTNE